MRWKRWLSLANGCTPTGASCSWLRRGRVLPAVSYGPRTWIWLYRFMKASKRRVWLLNKLGFLRGDSREMWDLGLRVGFRQETMAITVGEINHRSHGKPHDEPDPRCESQTLKGQI